MHLVKTLLASAAVAASFGAQAVITGSLAPGPTGPITPLTTENVRTAVRRGSRRQHRALGARPRPSATIVGGTVYATDMQFADDVLPGVPFLAAGPSSTPRPR